MAFWAGCAAGVAILVLLFSDFRAVAAVGGDFGIIWSGPRALLDGLDPYDATAWSSARARYGMAPTATSAYTYPPWVAVALLPLGALPVQVAAVAWTVLGVCLATASLRALVRAYIPGFPALQGLIGFALFASQAGAATYFSGQFGYVLVAVVSGIAVFTRSRRSVRAGILAGVLLLKPQYFLFLGWALLRTWVARRTWRAAVAAAIASAVVLSASLVVLGPASVDRWRHGFGRIALDDPTAPTLPNVLSDVLGPLGGVAAALALFLLLAIGLRFDTRDEGWLAVWIPLSVLAATYARSYDQVILIVPLVIAAGAASRRSAGRAMAVGTTGAAILTVGSLGMQWIAGLRANEDASIALTLALFVLFAAVLWPRSARASGVDRAGPG